MALFTRFRPTWTRTRLLALVDRVTARVQDPVWQRVRDRVLGMGIHEARGYIRARAAVVIDREMRVVVAQEPTLSTAHCDAIVRSVRHRVVRRMILESVRRQQPTRSERRRAA